MRLSAGSWSGDTFIDPGSMWADCIGGESSSDEVTGSTGARKVVRELSGDGGAGVACRDRTGDLVSGDDARMLSSLRRKPCGVAVRLGGVESMYSWSVGRSVPVLYCSFSSFRSSLVE